MPRYTTQQFHAGVDKALSVEPRKRALNYPPIDVISGKQRLHWRRRQYSSIFPANAGMRFQVPRMWGIPTSLFTAPRFRSPWTNPNATVEQLQKVRMLGTVQNVKGTLSVPSVPKIGH